jgi:hypothetical protein
MYNLSKKEKLDFVLKTQKELNITANTISKNTKLTEAGIQRIINGTSKNPQENSLNEIILFFEKKVLGTETDKKTEVNEPSIIYGTEIMEDIKKNPLVIALTENNRLTREILNLQNLLRINNISFKDIFNPEN